MLGIANDVAVSKYMWVQGGLLCYTYEAMS